MVVYYVNTYGFTQQFQVFQSDGTTVYDLTNTTVTWLFKDNTVTPATTKTIVGTITDATNGKVQFVIPSGFFPAVIKYDCQLQIVGTSPASTILTDPPFVVEILASQA